jgi:hypothetical protein
MSLIPSNRLLFLAPRRRRYEDVETIALDLDLDDPAAPSRRLAAGANTLVEDIDEVIALETRPDPLSSDVPFEAEPPVEGSDVEGKDIAQRASEGMNGGALKNGPPPPLSAEKLLLIALPPRISDAILGDLAEHFPSIQKRHGDRFARVWYWRHAVGSTCRFLAPRLMGAFSLSEVLRIARKFLPL